MQCRLALWVPCYEDWYFIIGNGKRDGQNNGTSFCAVYICYELPLGRIPGCHEKSNVLISLAVVDYRAGPRRAAPRMHAVRGLRFMNGVPDNVCGKTEIIPTSLLLLFREVARSRLLIQRMDAEIKTINCAKIMHVRGAFAINPLPTKVTFCFNDAPLARS